MKHNSLPLFVDEALEAMNDIPTPSPATLNTARRAFLAEARQLRSERPAAHRGFVNLSWLSQKEKTTMMAFARVFTAILLLAGAAGTAFAADASTPSGALYPVDLAMEQARLALIQNVQTRAEIHLRLAAERADELIILAQGGSTPDQAALERLQTQLQLSLQTAAQLQDQAMVQSLRQIQQMTSTRAQQMAQVGLIDGLALMEHARVQAQAGLADPAGFQAQYRNGAGWTVDDPSSEAGAPSEPVGQQNQVREQTQTCDPTAQDCEPVQQQEQTHQQTRDQQQACDPAAEVCEPVQEQQRLQERDQAQECDPMIDSCDQQQTQEQSQDQQQDQIGQPESPGNDAGGKGNGSDGTGGGSQAGGGKP